MADKSNPRVAVSVTVGAAEGEGLVGVQGPLTLLPGLSLVLQQLVSLVLSSPHPFSNSTPPRTEVVCYRLPAAWVNVCKFMISLADILETQCRVACEMVSCCQLPIQYIFWDAAIAQCNKRGRTSAARADRGGGVCCGSQHAPAQQYW